MVKNPLGLYTEGNCVKNPFKVLWFEFKSLGFILPRPNVVMNRKGLALATSGPSGQPTQDNSLEGMSEAWARNQQEHDQRGARWSQNCGSGSK